MKKGMKARRNMVSQVGIFICIMWQSLSGSGDEADLQNLLQTMTSEFLVFYKPVGLPSLFYIDSVALLGESC